MSPIKLPRFERATKLPDELINTSSPIGKNIRVATVAFEEGVDLFPIIQANLHKLCKKACPQYKADTAAPERLLCVSGQGNTLPFRGRTCANGSCQLSQVEIKDGEFFYTGPDKPELEAEDTLLAKILADVSANSK